MPRRRRLTYAIFAAATGLALVALAVAPRRTHAVAPPPVVTPPPPPIVHLAPIPPPPVEPPPIVKAVDKPPRIEVVFALDTTGSMSGLIEGAKRKIWSIADFLSSAQPRPEVRIGLVAYRDIGDEYVTRFYDLTDDIDLQFKRLQSFSADGGGDTPEHVARALHDAVDRASWSPDSNDQKLVKLIYVVGDAPPHTDYHDGFDYKAIARRAAEKGIHVNTVRCGSDPETAVAWKTIARLGHGDFSSVQQSGGMVAVTTPYDDKLAELNKKLAATAVGYGTAAHRHMVMEKVESATHASGGVAADRAAFSARNGFAVSGEGDLLNDVKTGKVKLDSLGPAALPAPIAAAAPPAQAAWLEEKQAERKKIIDEINTVAKTRGTYLEKARAKKAPSESGFDDELRRSVKDEAKAFKF